jgi:hypothetical protein
LVLVDLAFMFVSFPNRNNPGLVAPPRKYQYDNNAPQLT